MKSGNLKEETNSMSLNFATANLVESNLSAINFPVNWIATPFHFESLWVTFDAPHNIKAQTNKLFNPTNSYTKKTFQTLALQLFDKMHSFNSYSKWCCCLCSTKNSRDWTDSCCECGHVICCECYLCGLGRGEYGKCTPVWKKCACCFNW